MIENIEKKNSINIITHINELMTQTEVTQYFKNTTKVPIELEIVLPKLTNCNITKFEMIKNNEKIISKLLEKEKAKEKYNDTLAEGNFGFISYNEDYENKIFLGNISPNEEIELKTFYFGHTITKDLSYQASFPVVFPKFIMSNSDKIGKFDEYKYEKEVINGKIYINARSKITRLIISASKNFSKIKKKFSKDKKMAEIDIYKEDFSDKDIPGIVLFRTEKINDDVLYFQCDPRKNKSYYILQKTLDKPEFIKEFVEEIDEDENLDYYSLVHIKEENNAQKECYIFLLDQSGSMSGERIDLSCKSLLLFLQSLNENCYFQLIGFGSDSKFFSDKPLEYNKENVKALMDIIKQLGADRGGTELYEPLYKIYTDKIYNEYDMKKNIILLTDGELFDKEKVINLIGANSNEFIFNSIGIGDCDKDLIERTALIGNGYSYYISNLNELNSVVISLLEKSQNSLVINCITDQKCIIEDDNKKLINKNDYFTHGFILDDINMKNIEFTIKIKDKEIKTSFNKDIIVRLPDGDNLGKLIVDNYLKSEKCLDSATKINLSKEYNILTDQTSFYAAIINEKQIKEKMVKITNKEKEAENNKKEAENNKKEAKNIKERDSYFYNDKIFGYDNEQDFYNINTESDNIVKQKNYVNNRKDKKEGLFLNKDCLIKYDENLEINFELKESQSEKLLLENKCCKMEIPSYNCFLTEEDYDMPIFPEKITSRKKKLSPNKKRFKAKKEFNFDELILSQDVIKGNWTKDEQCKMLIKEEKDIYNKIKKYAKNKKVKDENGIITLFVLYYIHNKKSDKVNELKFIINKAKDYLKNIFKLEYNEIIKEIETK